MNEKETAYLLSLLNTAGAAIEAAFSLIEKDMVEDKSNLKACQHPKDKRKDLSTMGIKRWQCQACGYLYESSTGKGGDKLNGNSCL